ncbi:MAG: hypothetical protein NC311_03270 [Muribaculaceae bacterium]|nr:hypothetical protein [Muribaculaceae bacterium]
MRSRLDNILLGVLWLLAATLGATFWFNTKFGFNIFSAPHWQYLAYLQASHTPVMPIFYISMGIIIFITIFGLYLLTRPNFRKIVLPIRKLAQPKKPQVTPPAILAQHAAPQPAPTTAPEIAQPVPTPEQTPTPAPVASRPAPIMRPPHLTLRPENTYVAAPAPQRTAPQTNTTDTTDNELRQIFEHAGYMVKNNPYISGFRPNLLAIGTNEILWIGALGATTVQVHNAIDKLNQIFADTLEDVYIDINGFAINAPDAATSEFEDILMFQSTDALNQYMQEHQNTKPTPDEQENFDAYSEYIDTVIGYIGKL